MAFRRHWPSVWITVCSAALLVACGGGSDRIDRGLAEQLARQSESIAASLDRGDGCGAADQARALAARVRTASVTGRVPEPLRGPLAAAVADLRGRIVCTPPPPPPAQQDEDGDGGHRHGKGKGHGKGRWK